jgi:uncharacterized protein
MSSNLLKALRVLIAVASLAPLPSAAMECARATTPLEKLICGDATLRAQDALLSQTYFKLLKATNDPESHDLLMASQRRWLKNQQAEYKKIEPNDKAMILNAIQDRIFQLGGGKDAPAKAPIIKRIEDERQFASKFTGGPFGGYEIECWSAPEGFGDGAYVCVGNQTFQNDNRICRSTIEWASAHETEYRTVAQANGNEAKMIATCSTGYASSDYECPEADEEDPTAKKWNRQPTVTDSIPELKVRDDHNPFSKLDPDADKPDIDWITACLTDPNYPSPTMAEKVKR